MARDGDVADAANYLALSGVLRGVGQKVQVYVAEEDLNDVDPEAIGDVVKTFDERILPAAASTVGLANDVDGDGRFTVLFSSWLSRLGGGRHAVDGFVRVTDLDRSFPPPFSNRCDMMYLSASLKAGPHLRTILAHEYMHGVVFSQKLSAGHGQSRFPIEEEGWLDEALAHLFEDQLGFSHSNIDYRVSAFLSQPEHYQLVVEDYYAADLFRSHGNRGSTYLFLRWCADQFGPELIDTLVHSPLRGIANLEDATGVKFAELYRRWSVDLFIRGMEPTSRPADGSSSEGPGHQIETEWPIAGPRPHRVLADGPSETWEMAGTSSHYMLIPASESSVVEVAVEGLAAANLQVTAMPLPEDLGRLELTVQSEAANDGTLRIQAAIQQHGGLPVTIQTLAWEPLVPPADPHGPASRSGRIDATELGPLLGSTEIRPAGSLRAGPLSLSVPHASSNPVVMKLIGRDARGRRLAAWALLPGTSQTLQADAKPPSTRR